MPEPTTPATTMVAWLSELAAGSPSAGTTCGMRAPRAGVKNEPMLDSSRPRITSRGTSSTRCTPAKPRTTTMRSRSAASMTRRRFQRST